MTVFLPEPCAQCDAGQPCTSHGTTAETWPDEWLTADDRRIWR